MKISNDFYYLSEIGEYDNYLELLELRRGVNEN